MTIFMQFKGKELQATAKKNRIWQKKKHQKITAKKIKSGRRKKTIIKKTVKKTESGRRKNINKNCQKKVLAEEKIQPKNKWLHLKKINSAKTAQSSHKEHLC